MKFLRALEDTVEMCDSVLIGAVFAQVRDAIMQHYQQNSPRLCPFSSSSETKPSAQELCGEGEELTAYNTYAEAITSAEAIEARTNAVNSEKMRRRVEVLLRLRSCFERAVRFAFSEVSPSPNAGASSTFCFYRRRSLNISAHSLSAKLTVLIT